MGGVVRHGFRGGVTSRVLRVGVLDGLGGTWNSWLGLTWVGGGADFFECGLGVNRLKKGKKKGIQYSLCSDVAIKGRRIDARLARLSICAVAVAARRWDEISTNR